jgi:sugar/nucleoside kinase (ribokinase family)
LFDFITIGGASRDVFFMTSKGKIVKNPYAPTKSLIAFEYGSKIIPESTEFTYGGGGANSAVCFARLGLQVSAVVSVGAEGTGSLLVHDLESVGVDCDFVLRNREYHTALSMIVGIPGKDHTMFLYRGANNHLSVNDWRPFKTKWFYLSSLTGNSADIIPELFAYASAHNICVAWNPGSEQLEGGYHDMKGFLEITDVLILNRDEAMKLVLSKNNHLKVHDIKSLLQELGKETKGIVVVTDGGNGSYVFDHNKIYNQRAYKVDVIETTGSGDAYGATFVAVRFLGCSIEFSMKMAAYNAASVIQNVGAQKGLMNFDSIRAKIESEESVNDEDKAIFKK